MSATSLGPIGWGLKRDEEGHRTYKIGFKVQSTSVLDGPLVILGAAGLPVTGSTWSIGNDSDPWAFCYPTASVEKIDNEEEIGYHWRVDKIFSTKPLKRCQTDTIENPLDEPMKLSGSFVSFMKQAQKDRFGKLILSSSHEHINGLERPTGRHNVIVEQNVLNLDMPTVTAIENHLNDAPLWGLPKRKILFARWSWERLLYGTCTFYYKRRMEFEVRNAPDDPFDLEDVADMGYRRLKGQYENVYVTVPPSMVWVTDPNADKDNPDDFVTITDLQGNPTPTPVMLDNNGRVNLDPVNNPSFRPKIEILLEANLLALGIPTSF
jgi:hypothetical protein